MANHIADYLKNKEYQQAMRNNVVNVIESNASISKMIQGFELAIKSVHSI